MPRLQYKNIKRNNIAFNASELYYCNIDAIMKQKQLIVLRLDFFGLTTSFLCALHCMAMPLLLSFGGLSSVHFLENAWLESGILFISLLLALASLLPSWYSKHKKPQPIRLMLSGFILIALSLAFLSAPLEAFFTSAGALLIAAAHYENGCC